MLVYPSGDSYMDGRQGVTTPGIIRLCSRILTVNDFIINSVELVRSPIESLLAANSDAS